MSSILRYIGKRELNLSYEIKEFKPKLYCEPFSGSFNVGLSLSEQGYNGKLIFNDLDREIYNFWWNVKYRPKELFHRVSELMEKIKYAESDNARRKLINEYTTSKDKLNRATGEFVYRAFKSIYGLDFRWRKRDQGEASFLDNSDRLKSCRLCNLSYEKILSYFDSPNTFFYLDPPYDVAGVSNYYRCESTFFDHDKFREYVGTLRGKWIMTYNNSDYIQELYSDYNIYIIEKILFGKNYTELLITNYDKPRDTIINYRCDLSDYGKLIDNRAARVLADIKPNKIDIEHENTGFDTFSL